jgi:DNA-binding transcriptional LysR family regulator
MTEIVRALKEGRLHFGFVRAADLRDEDGLQRVRIYNGSTLSILAGDAATAPAVAREFLQWLQKNHRPLVQQGTTWLPVSEQVARVVGLKMPINILVPTVICETHSQAAAAAIQSASWCIVPTKIARLFSNKKSRVVEIDRLDRDDDMALVTYARHADKTPGVAEALDLLKMGLGAIMQTEISRSKL